MTNRPKKGNMLYEKRICANVASLRRGFLCRDARAGEQRLAGEGVLRKQTNWKTLWFYQVGEGGNNTTARNIPTLVYLILCKLFADFMDFSELCNEVVHSDDRT